MPIFDKLNPMMLHRLSQAVTTKTFQHDEPIVQQGEPGDAMYIVERGRCAASVENVGVVKEYTPGEFFGELALLTNEPRGASVLAVGECVCLVLHAASTRPILDACFCGSGELIRREEILKRIPIFEMLSEGELRQLATQIEQVTFPDTGVAIISEGDIGRDMYAALRVRFP